MIHLKKLIPDEPKRDGFFKGLKFDLFVDRIVKYVQDLHEQILECISVINSVDKTERKDGKDGRGIEYITLNEDNSITFGLSDNTSITTDVLHIESTVDLSDYYTKSEIDGKGYLTQHQSLKGYATEDWVNQQISQSGSFNPELYYSKNDIDGMNLISTSNIDNYIPSSLPANGGNSATVNTHTVNSDVPANAKFTDTQANWTEVDTTSPSFINNKPDLSNYIQKSQQSGLLKSDGTVDSNTYLTQHQQVDWNAQSGQAGYISNKPENLSDFTNDENFISSPCYPINNTYASSGGGTSQAQLELDSETYYKLGTVNQIYVALNAPTDNSKAHEWVMEFEAGASDIPFVIDNVNSTAVKYANGEPKFNAGSIYQVSIQEGLAIVVEFVPNQS